MRINSLAALLVVIAGGLAVAEPMPAGTVRAIDGDTVAARGLTVRLIGLDTPETGMHARCEAERQLGSRATNRLRQLLSGGGVDLELAPCSCQPGTEGTPRCNYGRACGILRIAGRDAAEILTGEGLARTYYCERGRCPRRASWCADHD